MASKAKFFSIGLYASTLLSVGILSSAAQAGFEWVPPAADPRPQLEKPQEVITPAPRHVVPETQPVADAPAPMMSSSQQQIHHIAVTPENAPAADDTVASPSMPMPVTQENTNEVAVEAQAAGVEVADAPVEAAPIAKAEELPVMRYEESLPKKSYSTAYGFGKDMPLALALRQIVPANYAFSFDPLVEIGTRVSWQGGNAWNVVLEDALQSEALSAIVYDDMVYVLPASAKPAAPEQAVYVETEAVAAQAQPAALQPASVIEDAPAYVSVVKNWDAKAGQTLQDVLSLWSDDVGVKLHWDNVYDYPMAENWGYEGDYIHAVDALLTVFEGQTPKPAGRFHPNAPEGPAVLVVEVER